MLDVEALALLGDHVALDFVNTIEDRTGHHPDDTLRTPDDLYRWARRVGIEDVSPESALGSPRDELGRVVHLRESVHAILVAFDSGHAPSYMAMQVVSDTCVEACTHRRLIGGPPSLTWAWDRPCLENVRYHVALEAASLLTDPRLMARTHLCAAELCGWFYLDHSKNNSRRWCSMRGCGTREKAKRRTVSHA